MESIPYQVNDGAIISLLPDGRTDYLHPAIQPYLDSVNRGELDPAEIDFTSFIISEPIVKLDGFHLTAPAIAFIEVTNLCNLTCEHCYAFSGPRGKRKNEMSTETILSLIDELGRAGVLQLFLTGGEIFAHRDAVKIIQHARRYPFSTQIFTNGTLITEEKLARLPAQTSFFISFDTAEPTRTIRGGMDYPKLRQCFDWMDKHNHLVRTAISIHNQNIDDVEETFAWCAENGYPRPQWLETHPIGRALLHPHILLRPEQIDRVFAMYVRCMERFVDEGKTRPPTSLDNGSVSVNGADVVSKPTKDVRDIMTIQTVKFCQRLEEATNREKCARSVAYIASNGDVYPCSNCMANGMHVGGNLDETPFMEIWRNGFDEIRQITFDDHKVCGACPVKKKNIWCQFRCPPLAINNQGSPDGCGATEYVREFMLRVHEYFRQLKQRDARLTLVKAPHM